MSSSAALGSVSPEGWVVVEDDGSGVSYECRFDHLSRVSRGAVDRAAEEILDGNQTVTAVEVQHTEDLVLAGAEVHAEKLAGERRGREHRLSGSITAGQKRLGAIEDIGLLRLAEAGLVANIERGHDGGP